MQPFTVHTGRAVPLRRSDVDTDQIIPSEWLKRIERTGFGAGLFAQWRAEPGFVLNDPAYAGASVLLAGPDFGTGSSREHAVWALQDYGFRVVISPRFADIFRQNALGNGLLPVQLPARTVEALMAAAEADPTMEVTIDLGAREVRAATGGAAATPGVAATPGAVAAGSGSPAGVPAAFEIDDFTRWRLMEGLDAVGLTLRHEAAVAAFEVARPRWLPTTA
jgi:3-isopropylmalate/(R)-2-methylmalate dehydratase small subunit